jgi:hypothetical protein
MCSPGRDSFRDADRPAAVRHDDLGGATSGPVQAESWAPSAINAAVPKKIDAIVTKALARRLDYRYGSAATFAAELRSVAAILDVRTGAAEPPTLAMKEPGRRLGWAVGAILTAIAGLVWLALRG